MNMNACTYISIILLRILIEIICIVFQIPTKNNNISEVIGTTQRADRYDGRA